MRRTLALSLALWAVGLTGPVTAQRECDPSYAGVCIPPPPPDLNCTDIEERDFEVIGDDPHGFDRDHDGLGCESR